MNKSKTLFISLTVLVSVVAVLMYNKSKMEARSKNDLQKSIPVSVATVSKMKLSDDNTLVGTVTANNDIAIISETEGRVTAIHARIGDFKSAGSVLMEVDDELKKAAYSTAEVNYEKAKKDMDRFTSLHEQHAVTDQQYESTRLAFKNAEAQYTIARRQYNDTKITTPISGIITARPVDVGTMVQTKMLVANVVDISKLKVKLNVSERDAFRLKAGDDVQVSTDIYPGVVFRATIETISAKSDEAHTYPVEIMMLNEKQHPLKAGMFARVTFSRRSHDEVLVIPRSALVGSIKHPQAYVVENNIARVRDLVVGNDGNTNLEILSGIREGETIVVNGQNNLKDNASVTIVE